MSIKIVHKKPSMIGMYRNGNYVVRLYDDGTKTRSTNDDQFNPDFPECIDINISNRCSQHCKFCYANASPDGVVANLEQFDDLFSTIKPFTEIAINGNDPTDPQLEPFLVKMRSRDVIVNMTVNQAHFIRDYNVLKRLVDKRLIRGLGVSLTSANSKFIKLAKSIPTLVIHTIVGVTQEQDYKNMYDQGLKLLILGYKTIGRGTDYRNKFKIELDHSETWLHNNLKSIMDRFDVVSFDNLALKQLDVQSVIDPDYWKSHYMGDDGMFTFYINLPDMTYSISSIHSEQFQFPITKRNVVTMFHDIKQKYKSLPEHLKY